MSHKIIKGNDIRKVSSFDFKVFSTVDKGVSAFAFKPFSVEIKKESRTPEKVATAVDLLTIDEFKTKIEQEYQRGLAEGYKNGYEIGKNDGFKEGYEKGIEEAKNKYTSEYNAKKEDYLAQLTKELEHIKGYIAKLGSFIEQVEDALPHVILKFVKDIIGAERKINDQLIISIVKKAIQKLRDYEIIEFLVNPNDADIVSAQFPGYNVIVDPSISPGSLKVKTKIGEADFTIESTLEELTKTIYEELGLNQKS